MMGSARGRYRVGVVGLGMGANVLSLNQVPGSPLEVTHICSVNPDQLEKYVSAYRVARASTDYGEMLADPELDIIAVYTPDAMHADHCVAALEAGKHVVCTKPMATDNAGAARIVEAVRRTGRRFMVAQTARFIPQYEHLKAMLGSSRLGTVLCCRAQYIHDLSPYLAPGTWRLTMPQDFMYGGGLHPIDLLRWYVGEVEEVFALSLASGRTPGYPIADDFILTLRFASGCIGTVSILCGVVHPPVPIIQVDLFGDAGSASASYSEGLPGSLLAVEERTSGSAVQRIDYPPETGVTYKHGESERRIFYRFAQCLDEGIEPEPGALAGARGVAVGDAAWQSVRSGQPARVRQDF
jgi:predicted dehydrogenase